MDKKSLKYFDDYLKQWLNELSRNSDCNFENLEKIDGQLPDPLDRASQSVERNYSERFCNRRNLLIRKIEVALQSIEDGTYGICERCGENIAIERLKARPVTCYCIECKTRMENYERLLGD
jgi:DnaK suppressor protein